jgi:hypothetical protein
MPVYEIVPIRGEDSELIMILLMFNIPGSPKKYSQCFSVRSEEM